MKAHSLPRMEGDPSVPLHPVRIPGSKSITNRALLLAALAPGTSRLRAGLEAEDTRWMKAALQALGVGLVEHPGEWEVRGGCRPEGGATLWLGASGTTLRFLLPWLALQATGPVTLQGDPRLFERPLGPLLAPLLALGATWDSLEAGGRLTPVGQIPHRLDATLDASLSSQFVTGLALAGAALPGGARLSWAGAASASYLALTAQWLARFGCDSDLGEGHWNLPGGRLHPADLTLPADWSGAAAFLAAAAVTGRPLRISPLDPQDIQGDRAMVEILGAAGCSAIWVEETTLQLQGPLKRGLDADLTSCPDLGPVLAATAALAPGPSVLTGLHTLPLKECDRLDASAELVRWLGGEAQVVGDHTLHVRPGTPDPGRPPFDPRNDHRMAFAAAVGGLRWAGEVAHPECVAKTYPSFWEDWSRMLGAGRA